MDQNESQTFCGTLIRTDSGFALTQPRGHILSLMLQRVPIDLVNKQVIVTGEAIDVGNEQHIIGDFIRAAH